MAEAGRAQRVLIVRPDRIGDVVLSTPVLTALQKLRPSWSVSFLVQPMVAPLLQGLPGLSEVLELDLRSLRTEKGLNAFVETIRSRSFDAAVVLQNRDWRLPFALWKAGVPVRVGPRGRLHSYLFYQPGVRQRRSRVEKHEADYNLDLLKRLGVDVPESAEERRREFAPRVRVSDEALREAKEWFASGGRQEGARRVVAIHPGMGGSALNWPEERYVELARLLAREPGVQVVVTAGPAESELLERVRGALAGESNVLFYGGSESRSIGFLAALYSQCSVVVAPSTGPLHVATAVGVPVVSFYPPVRVQSVRRWGPYVPSGRAEVLEPAVRCGQTYRCAGRACADYPCMETLSVSEALSKVRRFLA